MPVLWDGRVSRSGPNMLPDLPAPTRGSILLRHCSSTVYPSPTSHLRPRARFNSRLKSRSAWIGAVDGFERLVPLNGQQRTPTASMRTDYMAHRVLYVENLEFPAPGSFNSLSSNEFDYPATSHPLFPDVVDISHLEIRKQKGPPAGVATANRSRYAHATSRPRAIQSSREEPAPVDRGR